MEVKTYYHDSGDMMLVQFTPEENNYIAWSTGHYGRYSKEDLIAMLIKGNWYALYPGTLLRKYLRDGEIKIPEVSNDRL